MELQHHLRPDDDPLIGHLTSLARHLGLGCVATNNVHYATRDGARLHDVLTAIAQRAPLDRAVLRANSEYYLKPRQRLLPLFRDLPDALTNTLRIAERCQFQLRYGLQDLPSFPTPPGSDAIGYLTARCREGLRWRYGDPGEPARRQLAYELAVIDRAGLANYVLIVWDIVRFARTHGIRCQGRGSAANSLVAYVLGISPIDPLAHDLVFERFLSDERPGLPDIDIDIAADRREEVIQYVYERYGRNHAAMACTLVTFQARSALRDVAAALDLPPDLLGQTAQALDAAATTAGADTAALVAELCRQIDGLPRHLGQHNGGMVLTRAPLAERVPIEPAAMPGRSVVQWDKDALETAGLIKIDLLGLRMLAAIAEACAIIASGGARVDLDRLPFDDPAVYAMIAQADTIGVFQVESRAQAQILPKLRPASFHDLIIAISLIRPGPLQADMVHPYLRRRQGQEAVRYLHPLLEAALAETLGIMLFQEQVLKVARDLAGFTAGQGEQLRRALGAKRADAAIAQLREAFLAGAAGQGVAPPVAATVFAQLQAFGGYAFPKSHAAAYAVIVYQSAWLKRYHPAAFVCGLLNQQPMGFWPPAILVNDVKRHGVRVDPVDIQTSHARCQVVAGAIRLGLCMVTGLGAADAGRIVAARAAGQFTDLADLVRRTRLSRTLIERLILAGACDGWGTPRRALLWELGSMRRASAELDLPIPATLVTLPALTPAEAQAAERAVLGLTTGEQVMAYYRPWLAQQGASTSVTLPDCDDGQRVTVVGLCVIHQAPPTAKGYHFLTLEDEWGMVNVIVSPGLVVRDGKQLTSGRVLVITGVVQHEAGVTNLIAQRVAPLAVS